MANRRARMMQRSLHQINRKLTPVPEEETFSESDVSSYARGCFQKMLVANVMEVFMHLKTLYNL